MILGSQPEFNDDVVTGGLVVATSVAFVHYDAAHFGFFFWSSCRISSSVLPVLTESVLVKEGEHVKQGQQIANVGDTGDYYMAHLHFQISDQADAIRGRSLPFEFINLGRRPELGHFARLKQDKQ